MRLCVRANRDWLVTTCWFGGVRTNCEAAALDSSFAVAEQRNERASELFVRSLGLGVCALAVAPLAAPLTEKPAAPPVECIAFAPRNSNLMQHTHTHIFPEIQFDAQKFDSQHTGVFRVFFLCIGCAEHKFLGVQRDDWLTRC